MLVTSQLPIQTTKFAIISFQRALVLPHFEKGSAAHTYTYTMFERSWTIAKPHCFHQLHLQTDVGQVYYTVSLICTEVFLWLKHQRFH